jgi:hypothetical protein
MRAGKAGRRGALSPASRTVKVDRDVPETTAAVPIRLLLALTGRGTSPWN